VWGLDIKFRSEDGKIFTGQDLKDKKVVFRIGEKYKVMCPNVTFTYEYDPSIERRRLRAGEFGVICSHLELMNKIVDNKETSLILEDDPDSLENLNSSLDYISKNMPPLKYWQIISFSMFHKNSAKIDKFIKTKFVPFHPHLIRIKDFLPCRAYLFNYLGGSMILGKSKNIYTAIDTHLESLARYDNSMKMYYYDKMDIQDMDYSNSSINKIDPR